MDYHENLIAIHQHGEEMETQYDCSDIPDERSELDIARAIVRQWDNHDKFRVVAGEPNGEPDEVRVSRAFIRINDETDAELIRLHESLHEVYRQIERVNTDRDEIWSREKFLLDALHKLLDGINDERALTPSKPGWRVVEMVRDILVDTIETYQRTIRETVERDTASRG